jgi:hypothetical protein
MRFYSLLFYTNLYTSLRFTIQQQHSFFYRPRLRDKPITCGKHLFLLIHIFFNIGLTAAVHNNTLPISSLLGLPTIFGIYAFCSFRAYQPPFDHSKFIESSNSLTKFTSIIEPSSNDLSTDSSKLAYLYAWQSKQPSAVRLMNFSPGGKPICIDTGASCCISNDKADFIHIDPATNTLLKGIGSGLHIAGQGTICWKITTDTGDEVSLNIPNSLYVPSAPMCLLSPQMIAQHTRQNSDGFNAKGLYGIFTFASFTKTIAYNSKNNLPIFFTSSDLSSSPTLDSYSSTNNNNAFLSTEDTTTDNNLSPIQQKLLLKHQQMGHLNIARVQQLAKDGVFGAQFTSLANCDPPLCKACIHGKQHKRPTISSTLQPLDISHLAPGDCISGDELESTHPGLIPIFRGSPSTSFYHAGTLLVDHASRLLHFTPHLSTGATEAIQAKQRFELFALGFNRSIKRYHADNGVFTSKLFRQSCTQQNQQITFCGVDAHHQNGIAERYVQTITERARTMLIHAMINWPDIIQESFWPFAVQLAIDLHNSTPSPSGLTPLEIFSGTKSQNNLANYHPFGCPIFVLDPSLRQNNKIPRWKPRSRVGVCLGNSPHHASSVPLVYSTTTGLVSPQYHVVFDDKFTTINCLHTNKIPDNWPQLFTSSAISYVDEDFTKTNFYNTSSFESSDVTLPSQRETSSTSNQTTMLLDNTTIPNHISSPDQTSSFQREPSSDPIITLTNSDSHIDSTPNTSRQHIGWNQSHRYNTRFKKHHIASPAVFDHQHDFNDDTITAYLSSNELFSSEPNIFSHQIQNLAYTAYIKDTLHFGEMQKDSDRIHFETDMQREMSDLLQTDTVEVVPRSSLSSDDISLQPIWSFRRKRAPDWTVLKHRSCICPNGGMQVEGVNFWETYAPVVSWRTIRLTLILSLLSGLKSRQVDYVSAYTQAPLDCELYMNIPPGFIVQNNNLVFTRSSTKGNSMEHVLKIKKNMYGLKQAGNNWFDTLHASLIAPGFSQSSIDPCLFIRSNCIIIVYVDDCLLFAKTDKILDSVVASLESEFNLTSQGDVGAFLGVDIQRNADGYLELKQPGLITKIISLRARS